MNESPAIVVEQTKDESEAQAIARITLSPSLQAALTLREYGKSFENVELMSLVEELRHQVGDSGHLMLMPRLVRSHDSLAVAVGFLCIDAWLRVKL